MCWTRSRRRSTADAQRCVEAAERHRDCEYFVLDLHHDMLAIPALEAYIKAAREHGYHRLAADLQKKIDDVQGGAVTA